MEMEAENLVVPFRGNKYREDISVEATSCGDKEGEISTEGTVSSAGEKIYIRTRYSLARECINKLNYSVENCFRSVYIYEIY